MTTLTNPSLERRLLQTVREEVAAKPLRSWPQRSLQLCLNFLREIRVSAREMRQTLENELANGVEARSFVRTYGPSLPAANDYLAFVREWLEWMSQAEDAASAIFVAELRLLERETQTFRDLLGEALSRASEPARPVEEDRVRAAEEAYTRGRDEAPLAAVTGGLKESRVALPRTHFGCRASVFG